MKGEKSGARWLFAEKLASFFCENCSKFDNQTHFHPNPKTISFAKINEFHAQTATFARPTSKTSYFKQIPPTNHFYTKTQLNECILARRNKKPHPHP
ncbi:MAG: hypothetical protein IPM82_00735 [Saprospiraceae bacterium]|nr:hypothetical protein [Saprospiraceae bacterium]